MTCCNRLQDRIRPRPSAILFQVIVLFNEFQPAAAVQRFQGRGANFMENRGFAEAAALALPVKVCSHRGRTHPSKKIPMQDFITKRNVDEGSVKVEEKNHVL